MTTADISVTHDSAGHRFTALVDGQLSELDFHEVNGVMWTTHTGVPAALEGRGIAAALVRTALGHARAQGWRVRPVCSYVRAYMQRHPETLDLLEHS